MEEGETSARATQRKVEMTKDVKVKLARLVKNYTPLWLMSDPNHRRADKLLKCWDEIAM